MSEAVAPVADQVEVEPIEAAGSIADHKAQFSKEAQATPPGDDDSVRPHHAAQQRRDRENGTFNGGMKPGPKPGGGKFDQAEVDAATRRLKAAEEKYFAEIPKNADESDRAYRIRVRAELIERHDKPHPKVAQLEQELSKLRTAGAAPAQIQQQARKVDAAGGDSSDPEPTEDDPKYGGDWTKYWDDRTRWVARDENRNIEQQRTAQARRQESDQQLQSRVDAAKKKYPDFEQVANDVIAKVPQGSTVEQWIFANASAEDVVYHFKTQPQELDAILRLPSGFEQFKALTLLEQRLASSTLGSTGTTGSVAERVNVKPLPKPPNPVRTEAQRASDAPPPTDGSLGSIDAHKRHFGKR